MGIVAKLEVVAPVPANRILRIKFLLEPFVLAGLLFCVQYLAIPPTTRAHLSGAGAIGFLMLLGLVLLLMIRKHTPTDQPVIGLTAFAVFSTSISLIVAIALAGEVFFPLVVGTSLRHVALTAAILLSFLALIVHTRRTHPKIRGTALWAIPLFFAIVHFVEWTLIGFQLSAFISLAGGIYVGLLYHLLYPQSGERKARATTPLGLQFANREVQVPKWYAGVVFAFSCVLFMGAFAKVFGASPSAILNLTRVTVFLFLPTLFGFLYIFIADAPFSRFGSDMCDS